MMGQCSSDRPPSNTTVLEQENILLKTEVEILKTEIKSLKEAEAKYRRIFEAVPASIYVVNRDGIITEVNCYHVKRIGRGKTTKEDYVNQNVLTRPTIVRAGLVDKFASVLHGQELDEKEIYLPVTSGGPEAYVTIRGVPLYRNGEMIGAIFISQDITHLKKNEAELLQYREHLEDIIEVRTQELQMACEALQQENIERQKAEADKEVMIDQLQAVLDQVKKLSGLLPICASCKKIRDDDGYWHQVEVYIRDHSEARFSHGICPDCMEKLYPGYVNRPIK